MTDDRSGVTRRRALTALGTIGAAAAVAGAGTSAFFSDREVFANDTVVAGELDLKIAWRKTVTQRQTTVERSSGFPTPRNDAAAPICDLSDVKPGDSGRIEFVLEIDDNPGYVSLVGAEQADEENGQPESDALNGALPDGSEAELDELVDTTISYGAVGSGGVNAMREAYTASLASIVDTGDVGIGVPLDGDGSASVFDMVVGGATPAPFAPKTRHGLQVEFTVPQTVGNGIQADEFRFAVGFYTEQARGNRR